MTQTDLFYYAKARPGTKCCLILKEGSIHSVYRAKLGREFISDPDTQKSEFNTEDEALQAAIRFRAAVRTHLSDAKLSLS
jgi:hypothetical protein